MKRTRDTRAGGSRAAPRAPRAAWAAPLLAALGLLGSAATAGEPCAPWPGEPTPLPALDNPDLVLATWAELRVRELSAQARQLEASDSPRAGQLWRRVLCIAPTDADALAGAERNPALRLHRPPLEDAPFADARVADPWRGLDAPLGVRAERRAEPLPDARAAELRALRDAVSKARAQVQAARFDAALASVASLRPRLERAPPSAAISGLRVDLAVVAATAELALGRESDAVASLRRALAEDPNLDLDPTRTAPKVLRALERARAEDRP